MSELKQVNKTYTVELTDTDMAMLIEMLGFMGKDKQSTQHRMLERKLYKAIGLDV